MKKYISVSARIFKYEIRNVFEKCALLDMYMWWWWGGGQLDGVCQLMGMH